MAPALNTLAYGKVTGRFIALVADTGTTDLPEVDPTNDADDLPDVVTLSAEVTFTPSVDQVLLDGSADGPARLMLPPIVAYLDNSGQLIVGGRPYVKLLATDSPHVNPSNFSWRVSFQQARYGTGENYVTIPPFDIEVPSNGEVDLTRVAPIPSKPGTVIVRDEALAKEAQRLAELAASSANEYAAAAAAAMARSELLAARDKDLQARQDLVNLTATVTTLSQSTAKKYEKPTGGIPNSDLAAPGYVKPAGGIPNSDLATPGYVKPASGIPAGDIAGGLPFAPRYTPTGDHSALLTRHYIRLAIVDPPVSATASSSVEFLVSDIGDERRAGRATMLVQVGWPTDFGYRLRSWVWGVDELLVKPEMYGRIVDGKLEVWGLFSNYQSRVVISPIGGAATFPLDETASAPAGLLAETVLEDTRFYVKPAAGIPNSDLAQGPKYGLLLADQTRSTSSTTVAPFQLRANFISAGTWLVDWFIILTGDPTADAKFLLQVGTNLTSYEGEAIVTPTSATALGAEVAQALVLVPGGSVNVVAAGTVSTTARTYARIHLVVTTLAPDQIDLSFGQLTTVSGTPSAMKAGSTVEVVKIA